MSALRDALHRLLASLPDLPEPIRSEVASASEPDALLALIQRRAAETLRTAQEHHRKLEALIRRP